jgi:glutamyl-tRNA(Gln) and/or aspartyl-tRNA(Asn) amidotransferase, C subunit
LLPVRFWYAVDIFTAGSLCSALSVYDSAQLSISGKSARIVRMTTHKTIDEDTLEKLLHLSRLSPESTNLSILKKQVDDIVGYFEILSKYDDSENPYDAYPSTEADKLREDEAVAGLDISNVKKISKDFMDGYFQVPKVLGEGA